MQISKPYANGPLPPASGGGVPGGWQDLQAYYQRIHKRRDLFYRWAPIILTIIGSLIAAYVGSFTFDYPKETFGALVGLPLLFIAIWKIEFGFVFLALTTTPFVPTAFKTDWFYVSPAVPLLILLIVVAIIQIAFYKRKVALPSIWTIWPLILMLLWAFFVEILVNATWVQNIPRVILTNEPLVIDEAVGLAMYSLPLLMLFCGAACISSKDKWIHAVLHTFLVMGLLDAAVLIVKYRSIGGDVTGFRYAAPQIGWMPLEALAQLLALGAIIGYAYALINTKWKLRIIYGTCAAMCLAALYISLENSWWTEAALAFVVITIVFSWRFFLFCCASGAVLLVAALPLLQKLLDKLNSKAAVDQIRFTIWQDMLRNYSQRPVTGVGPGNVWAYDMVFSHLPIGLRDIHKSGLGVAHNGYLQTLAELGPFGIFLQLSFLVIIIIASYRLFRYARKTKDFTGSVLGLVGLGLVCGSMVGDATSSYFFLPPRQALHVSSLTQSLTGWVIYGCVLYRDQIRRMAVKALKRDQAIG